MAARTWLIALSVAASTAAAVAAPAPIAKPDRHAPTTAALLAELRAAGFSVSDLERGPEPGLYRVTVWVGQARGEGTYLSSRTYEVRVKGADVRGELRAFLERYQERFRRRLSEEACVW